MVNNIISATVNGNLNKVRNLISNGVNVNKADDKGMTSLMWASMKGHAGVVKLLLNNGANVNKADKYGKTPLLVASYWGHTEVVKLLLEKGANVNKETRGGGTPLSIASGSTGDAEVVKLLLEKGANVNKADKYGSTPLHQASMYGKTEVVKLLLTHPDIKVSLTDYKGRTPLSIAKNEPIKVMLLEKMGSGRPYRNMNTQEKNKFKPILLKRLLINKRNNKYFKDPITHKNYNMRTLEPKNNSAKTLTRVGLIIDNKNKPIRLMNYDRINNFSRQAGTDITAITVGFLNKDWSLIPFTKEELNKVYKDLGRISVMAKGTRTRKNLSTLRSPTSSNNNKAKAKNRIKSNEKKTETIAKLYRNKREIEKKIRNLM